MSGIRLISGVMTVGFWTLASRILGFARDILIAAWLGTGPVAQAFIVAFSLPNMFRRFFAEGAFNMAFVPMFSKRLEKGEDALGFARQAMAGLGVLLILLTLVALIFMPWLVLAMASGFAGDERLDMAVTLGRICFIYILFISLAALTSGVLNAAGRFAAAAAAPVLLNIVLITFLMLAEAGLFASVIGEADGARHGSALAVGVVVAGIAQLALAWIAAKRAGFPLTLTRPRLTPEIKRLAVIAAPAMLAGGVVQVNLLVGRQVASYFDGAIVWLSFADRLYQLPLGVVGIAIGIVLLPDLSRRLAAEDIDGSQYALSRAGEISLALAIPAAVALMVIPGALTAALFERGFFTAKDTEATALACAIYGLGLPAFVMQKVLQPLYFAREDTKRPFYFALAAMVINAGLAIGLAPVIGYLAAALGATLAGWGMLALLWWGARNMGEAARFDSRFKTRLTRILAAALVMGAVLWILDRLIAPQEIGSDLLRFAAVMGLCLTGAAAYGAAGLALKAFTLQDLKGAVKRG
ncbi:MAG: murein biosynthesis integral membrane protein MurJ [Silicimonas sp.]|nr:murein biosynthesis integral membrane protein MurJ [Silicimonas sp.]